VSKGHADPPRGFDPFTRTTLMTSSGDHGDFYHRAVRMPWPSFLGVLSLGFVAINVLFGTLYMLGDQTIAGARPDSFADHFFFSVQTIATIGYGAMYPHTTYGHILVALEAMIGLFGVGIVAALAFARFSLPTARIRFSRVAVIADFDGTPTLMLRAANERRNSIIAARVQMSLLRPETTREGMPIRRFYDLDLARSETPIFSLSWLIMHPITPASPLYKITEADLQSSDFAVLATITGLDENLSHTLHARHAYLNTDIRLNHRFVDMVEETAAGDRLVDLRRIDATEKIVR
jgi:inward rectifier potassium channel